MLVGVNSGRQIERVAARSLDTDELLSQWSTMLCWVHETDEAVINSKFSIETAWFREIWYELGQRQLLRIH